MWTIARQELRIILRSKWIFSFAFLFALLAVIITTFGAAGAESGYTGFNRTTASLLNVSLFLIPLLTMLAGSTALAGEKEDGGLGLLLTYPVKTGTIIAGKYIGMFLALFAVISFGYGVAGGAAAIGGGSVSLPFFLLFYSFSVLLILMFLSIGFAAGTIAKTRFHALGLSVLLWAVFVLFYEFGVIGLSMAAGKDIIIPLFSISILLNPAELVRVWTIIAMGSGTIFGPTLYDLAIWSDSQWGQAAFAAAAAVWIAVPLLAAGYSLKRGIHRG